MLRIVPSGSALTLQFSSLMADDRKALAQGLRRRDPELLDRLIEVYPFNSYRNYRMVPRKRQAA